MRSALVLLGLAACGDDVPDKIATCQLQSAATVQDRKVIGPAAPYDADFSLGPREDELRTSIAARRAAAWQVVARVLHPVPLGEPALAQTFGGQPTVPAWHTWYGRDDFERVFKKLYRDLGPAGRRARARLDAQAIDAGFDWNTHALDGLPDWPEQRYLDYLAQIDTLPKAAGIAGANRVGYSPSAMRQLIHSYGKQYACRLAPSPEPFDTDPMRAGTQQKQVEQLSIESCQWRTLGPYVAGVGAQVTVTMHGDGDADVYVRRGAVPDGETFDCRSNGGTSDESCSVDGGALIYVSVFGAKTSMVEVDVEYLQKDVVDPACLDGEMPGDAAVVKGDWHRVLTDPLPTFDTSATRMAARLAGDASWGTGDGAIDPDPAAIYTVTLPNGATFRMPALHVMTKELEHWIWITLWWSPQPDSDFGADRPAEITGPWRNYKMCVASSYLEGDPDPRGGQPGSLGDALAAVHGGVGAPTWCSNPYLELGTGNAATNCIGCHQHGGTDLLPEAILAAEPHHGTTRVRNNFFTDYLWAIKGGGGEDLSSIIQAEVDYWDANDPP
ncbi:MAG: hypothetical protein JWO36_5970 [Myxococcales bacterium]|nr:hypothetical protein [Myxococcales bacterium]